MNYGNIKAGLPYQDDVLALEDLLAKGEIGEEEYKHRRTRLSKIRLAYICASNGAYTAPKMSRRLKEKLADLRDRNLAQRKQGFAEEISEELNSDNS